jgi:hypothetical protein
MSREKKSIIIISFLVLIILILTYFVASKPKTKRYSNYENVDIYYAELIHSIYSNEGLAVGNAPIYYGINRTDTIKLSELARENSILVFRFSSETCNICIDFVIDRLKKAFPDYESNSRIVLLSSQVADRLKKTYYGKPLYSFYENELDLPFEPYRIPYIFILEKDMKARLFFVPEESSPVFTDFYLNTVKTRFGL